MNNELTEKQIWTLKTKDEVYNPRLGVVYKEIVRDYSYEILLASTELDLLSDADMIIPTKHSTLPYSVTVHANQIFPALIDADFFQNQIGKIDNFAHKQLKQLRNENSEIIEVKFEVGGPIIFHSDRRYSLMLHNLSIVNQLGQDAINTVFIDIPDNIVPLITFKSKKEMNIIEALDTKLKNVQTKDLLGRSLLMAFDAGISIEDMLVQQENGDTKTINFMFETVERARAVLVA
jgi:hypothetical protein